MSSTVLFDRSKQLSAVIRSHARLGTSEAFLVCTITVGEDEVVLHIPARRAPQFAEMIYKLAEDLRGLTISENAPEDPVTVALSAGIGPDTLAAAEPAPRDDTGAESEDERG